MTELVLPMADKQPQITAGWAGFVVLFLSALVLFLLGKDLIRRMRRVRLAVDAEREELRAQQAAARVGTPGQAMTTGPGAPSSQPGGDGSDARVVATETETVARD